MEHKKFNTAEVVIGGLFTLAIDVVSALLDLAAIVTGGITYVIAVLLQAGTSAATSFWLMSKGGKRAFGLERQLTKQIANFLPWIPTCFTAFMIEAVMHNNPKLAGVASGKVVGSIKPKIKSASETLKKAA